MVHIPLAMDVGTDLISIIWYEYGRPFIQAKLHQLGQKAIAYLEAPTKASQLIQYQDIKADKIIDAAYEEISETDDLDDNDKIIRFPSRRVS